MDTATVESRATESIVGQARGLTRPTQAEAEAAVRTLIEWAGDDPDREGLVGTPERVVRAYEEFFAGYRADPVEMLQRTFSETDGYDEMVVLRDIEFFSHCEHHIAPIIKATNNIAGQPEHEVVDALKPGPGDLVLNKTTQGALRSPALDSSLRALGVDTVVSTGVSTNNCVAMTSMEACDLQYRVVVTSDATGTDSEEMQEATLTMLKRLWSRVLTTDEVLSELTAGGSRT